MASKRELAEWRSRMGEFTELLAGGLPGEMELTGFRDGRRPVTARVPTAQGAAGVWDTSRSSRFRGCQIQIGVTTYQRGHPGPYFGQMLWAVLWKHSRF